MRYSYWAWLLLSKFFKRMNSSYILIYDQFEDVLKVYDFKKNKYVKYAFKNNLDILLSNWPLLVDINEFEEFYQSLSEKQKKEILLYGYKGC